MADRNDIKKAKEKINNIINLGQEIQKSAQYLNDIKSNLDWYEDTCNVIKENEYEIIFPITGPLQNIQAMGYSDFNAPSCSGIAATFMSASAADTRDLILSSASENHYLLKEYDEIYKTDDLINDILRTLKKIDSKICNHFGDVKTSYAQWKAGMRSNSDLAKDTRTFQEQIEGTLNKLRIPKVDWDTVKMPKMSWDKMVAKISKKGSENKKAFMKQQKISEDIWKELTPVLKKTKTVNTETMESLFKRYVEHIYAVLNLIDEDIINQ